MSNKTSQVFVDVKVTGIGINYTLELNYPVQPNDQSKIVNSDCGVHVQYVSSHSLNKSINIGNNYALKI